MKTTKRLLPAAAILFALCLCSFPAGAQVNVNVLHSFPAIDGQEPLDSLTLSSDGATLYGTTSRGGAKGRGTIFQMAAAGGPLTILHHFGEPNANYDGREPHGSLTLSKDGTTLYGTTSGGGADGFGTLFSYNIATKAYAILHSFRDPGVESDGMGPQGRLALSPDGTTLYGTTTGGGPYTGYYYGTLFSYNIATAAYAILHYFGSGNSPPQGGLTLSPDGATLYGMVQSSHDSQSSVRPGAIFKIGTGGGTMTYLHVFTESDGAFPQGLTLSSDGTTLYGVTNPGQGGWSGNGTLFRMDTAGTGFAVLHAFGGSDGKGPQGSLTLSGDGATLYGMTTYGGAHDGGAVFAYHIATNAYSLLHSFERADDGGVYSFSTGSLTLSGDGATLYGMRRIGGAANGGAVFRMDGAGAAFSLLHSFGAGSDEGRSPWGSLTRAGDGTALYGMTLSGGAHGQGTLFRMAAGAAPTVLHAFGDPGVSGDGRKPYGSVTLSGHGTTLYGMTYDGGAHGKGALFSYDTATGAYGILHSFGDPGVSGDGESPPGSPTLSGDGTTLYGMTYAGGANGKGALFSYDTATGAYAILHSFGDPGVSGDGQRPWGSLALSSNGSALYGMTMYGGASGKGALFSYDTAAGAYAILHAFGNPGVSGDGREPWGSLTLSRDGTTLYGTAFRGGASNVGAIFSYNLATTAYAILHSFLVGINDGGYPTGSLTLSGDGATLWGMAYYYGAHGQGTLFKMDGRGITFTVLHDFGDPGVSGDGQGPYGDLTLASDGTALYGMTPLGGANGGGAVFSLTGPTVFRPFSFLDLVIKALKVLTGQPVESPWEADRTGDRKVGMDDALMSLQEAAGFRQ